MILKVTKLSKDFENNEAFKLHDISFEIKEKEKLCIVGPVGSGKTSVLRLISGLEKEYEGKIEVKKDDLCVVLKNTLFKRRTVYSNLLYPYMVRKTNPKQAQIFVEESLDLFKIKEICKTKIRKLTDFELIKVYLARAFNHEAKVYLMDNLLDGLRTKEKEEILSLLKYFKDKAIVFTEDTFENAKLLSDKYLFLNYGYSHGVYKENELEDPKDLTILKIMYPKAIIKDTKECIYAIANGKTYKYNLKSEKLIGVK